VRFAAIVQTHFALAGLALRDVSPSTGVSPLALNAGQRSSLRHCYVSEINELPR
jgi:hypothetical protein